MNTMRRLSKRLSVVRKDVLSNDVISFRGVSINVLQNLCDALLNETAAHGIELYVCEEDHDRFRVGDTLQLVSETASSPSLLSFVTGKAWAGRWRNAQGESEDVDFLVSKFRRKERREWTVEDVSVYILMPRTELRRERFIDTLNRDARGSAFDGTFVCQAHGSSFAALVHALVAHFENKQIPDRHRHVWLDVISANQHLLHNDKSSDKLQFLLESSLRRAIDKFEDRVVFIDHWHHARPLKRTWCIWEMHVMRSRSGPGAFHVIVPPQVEADIPDMLLRDFDEIRCAYEPFDAREAEAMNDRDQDMIQAIFRDVQGGYMVVNSGVLGVLRLALLEVVTRAVKTRVEKELGTDSLESTSLLTRLGILLTEEQLYDPAIEALRTSLSTLRKTYGSEDLRVAQVLGYIGHSLADQGSPNDAFKALSCYEEELSISRRLLPENHPDIATVLNNLACLLEDVQRFDEALAYYLEALDIRRQQPDSGSSEEEAIVLLNIGSLYYQKGQLEEAKQYTAEAVDIFKAIDEGHERLPEVYTNLAVILHSQGDVDAAMSTLQSAEVSAPDADTQADIQLLMANILDDEGNYEEALKLYETAYSTLAEKYGARHTRCADVLNFIGALCQARGKFKDALVRFEEAHSIRAELLGEQHPETAQVLFNMAQSLESLGRINPAVEKSRAALAAFRSAYGSEHPDTEDAKRQLDRLERIARELGDDTSEFAQPMDIKGRLYRPPPAGARRSKRQLLVPLHN